MAYQSCFEAISGKSHAKYVFFPAKSLEIFNTGKKDTQRK